MALSELDMQKPSEPGIVNTETGVLILSIINTLLIVSLIVTSKLRGFRLAIVLGLAYYTVFTFLTQIETWYFLGEINVSFELLIELLIMGLPVPIIFIPLAIFICGRWKGRHLEIPPNFLASLRRQLIWKIFALALIYVIIYWLAGYYIAWQNPELREFYGSPGAIQPFWQHTLHTIIQDPGLLFLQIFRGGLFALVVFSIVRYSSVNEWITGLLIGFFLAAPHFGHIISNPLIPIASVRLSHLIETAPSTFLYGLIIVWLLNYGTAKA